MLTIMPLIGVVLYIPAIIALIIIGCITANKRKNNPPAQNTEICAKPAKQPREKLSASVVTLLIGTVFIVLSAITFVAANWVKMNETGRVTALLSEAGIAFGISALLKKVIKLNRTSISFYMIGTIVAVIAFITAGYYGFFGNWFSVEGNGEAALYAVSALAAAASSFAAKPIYRSRAFDYIGVSFVSVAIIFICGLPFYDYNGFALTIAFAQTAITAVIHFLKPQKDTEMERPITVIGNVSAVIYQTLACFYVIATTFEPTEETFLILALLLSQSLIYGIFKHKKQFFVLFNIIGLYTAVTVSAFSEYAIGSDNSLLLLAFIAAVFFIVNRFIPRNSTSCRIITLIGAVIGSIASFSAGNEHNFLLCLAVPAVTSVGIASYSVSGSKSAQTAAGLFAPVIPFAMAAFLNSNIISNTPIKTNESEVISYGILTLIYIAAAAFFIFVPKISPAFNEKYPIKSQVIIYSDMIAAAAALLNISRYSQLFMIPAALCILHFAVSYAMDCNITAAGSVISLIIIIHSVLDNTLLSENTVMYIMFAVFAVLTAASRILFPDGITFRTDENKFRADVILLSSWTAVIWFPLFDKTAFFLRMIALSVFIAGFIKKNTSKSSASVLLTVSSTIACISLAARPFLTPDSSMIASKINIGIFTLLGVSYKFIWKDHKYGSKLASTVIFIISFACLIIDGIIFDNVANKIFVLAVIAGILALSFFAKLKTWFTASSAAIVIMTVASTYKYFNSAGWWLYLLIVGVIFITIASVNEICRKNGESMRSAAAKKFSDWKW